MSEDPPPLRLKPRLRPAEEAPAPPAAAPPRPPGAVPLPPEASEGKLRLKPRLTPDAPPPANAPAPPRVEPPAAPAPLMAPPPPPSIKLQPPSGGPATSNVVPTLNSVAPPVPGLGAGAVPGQALPPNTPPSVLVPYVPPSAGVPVRTGSGGSGGSNPPIPLRPAGSISAAPPLPNVPLPPLPSRTMPPIPMAPPTVAMPGPGAGVSDAPAPDAKFKLKQPPGAPGSAAAAAGFPAESFPAPGAPLPSSSRPPIHIRPGAKQLPPNSFRRRIQSSIVAKIVILLISVVVVGSGVMAYVRLMGGRHDEVPVPVPKPVIKPAPVAPPAAAPAAAHDASSDLLTKVTAAPGNLIDKGQSAILSSRASNQERIDAIADGQDVPVKPEAPKPTVPVESSTAVGPGVTTSTSADTEATVSASTAFRTFVADAKIDGVFQGNPPRVLMNGRVMREGQEVDITLNVVLDHVDVANKILYFKDKSGSIVSKRY